MNNPTSFFSKKFRGLSAPVATIILVVIAIALALLVGVLTSSKIAGFAKSESIQLIEASAYYLEANNIYVIAHVKNDGSTVIENIAVTATYGGSSQTVGTISTLAPGQEASVSATVNLAANRGDVIVIEGSGNPSGDTTRSIKHAVSVPVV